MDDSNQGSLRTYVLYLLLVVGAIALVGTLSFHYFEETANPARAKNNIHSLGDSFWWTMVTITTIGYGDIFPTTTGGRAVALFLMFAGIGTLGVSTAAIAAYFVKNDQLQRLRMQRLRDHVVICGLGRKGLLLARSFRERGETVIVIEQDEANEQIAPCREQGVLVWIGDATEQETLVLARVRDAKCLIAFCGDDGANARIAAYARELVAERPGRPLTCVAHIVDPELWYLLRRWEISARGSFRLQFFNVFDAGARALLDAHPPFQDSNHLAGTTDGRSPHLLVIGAGRLGQYLVVHAARHWREHLSGPEERLRITVVDRDTTHLKEDLQQRYPGLEKNCEIEVRSIDIRSTAFLHGDLLSDLSQPGAVTAIYICLDDETPGLCAALALVHRVRRHGVPIVIRMSEEGGLATLLRTGGEMGQSFDPLHPVGLLENTCRPDVVLGGTNAVLARAIHENYVRDERRAGRDARTNPSLLPWEQLPEELRESNRSQADHIEAKLRAIGCDIAPLSDWEAEPFSFSPEEIAQMATMEHERWSAERRAQGWSHGPRDNERKTHPSLVDWDELTEAVREQNREAIRSLPDLLARAGFQIYRLHGTEGALRGDTP